MKRLILVLAIVMAFVVIYAGTALAGGPPSQFGDHIAVWDHVCNTVGVTVGICAA